MADKTIFVLNGPNLNLLGTREPEVYGYDTLDQIMARLAAAAAPHGFAIDARQSNHEGTLVDWLHAAQAAGELAQDRAPDLLASRLQAGIFGLRAYAQRGDTADRIAALAEDMAAEIESLART